jgi:hypothetical protein
VSGPPGSRLLQQVGEMDREQARDAAADELSKPDYQDAQPPLLLRALGRALREIGELLDSAAAAAPGGPLGLLLLFLLIGLLVAVVLGKVRPGRGGRADAALFEGGRALTAAEHRARAEAAACRGPVRRRRARAAARRRPRAGGPRRLDPRPGAPRTRWHARRGRPCPRSPAT